MPAKRCREIFFLSRLLYSANYQLSMGVESRRFPKYRFLQISLPRTVSQEAMSELLPWNQQVRNVLMVGNLLNVKGMLKISSPISWLCGTEGTMLSRGPRDQPVWDGGGEPVSASFRRAPAGKGKVRDSLQPPCWAVPSPRCSRQLLSTSANMGFL